MLNTDERIDNVLLLDKLKSPPKENKSVPFWSINDSLDSDKLIWQIDEMKRMKMGGFFYHARGGYKGDYLGEQWMNNARVAINHAKKIGMDAWVYDEAGWPSGFAGGMINGLGDKYHQRWLKLFIQKKADIESSFNSEDLSKKPIAAYILSSNGKYVRVDFNSLNENTGYHVVYNISTYSYVDVINPDVTSKFIESTYQKYYDTFKDDMGRTLPGIFTDEPQYANSLTPWSYIIPDEFFKAYGYDLTNHLMALFEDYEGAEKIRYDFYNLLHRLFVNNYMKQLYDWCETHNCKLTGHILAEDSIATEMTGVAGTMTFYEYMQVPGIDWLGRTAASTVACKQLQSAANQLGKRQTLSEMFGCTGWDVSFDDLKWIAETQYVNGINLMCQHLESYTLRGQRKRDFPPSLFYQQSWWELYPQFNEYFNRLSALLTEGIQGVDILMLHPIHTGWMLYKPENPDKLKAFSLTFDEISEKLGEHQIDFHYGDEILMAKYAKTQNKELIIGHVKYKVILIPQTCTIDESTYKLLMDFAASGGKLASYKTFPTRIDGAFDDRISILKEKVSIFEDYDSLITYLKNNSDHYMNITSGDKNAEGLRYMERVLNENQSVYYILNKDRNKDYNTTITFKGVKDVKLLDLITLELKDLTPANYEDKCKIKLDFKPMQSRVLICNLASVSKKEEKPNKVQVIKPDYNKNWVIDEVGLNSLTIDYCQYRVNKGDWSQPVQTHLAFKQLLEYRKSKDIDVKMYFTLEVQPSSLSNLYLVIEDPQKWQISLNSHNLNYVGDDFWKDSAFCKIDIMQYTKIGVNELLISGNFYQRDKIYDVVFGDNTVRTELNRITYDTELESVYILGDFGVKSLTGYECVDKNAITTQGPFVITEAPKAVLPLNLTTQGFCFFAETIKLSQKFYIKKDDSRIFLDISTPDCPAAEIYINGSLAGNAFWLYDPIDITGFVNNGENNISVKLYSSNRNLLGPHHHIDGEIYWVGPFSFTNKRNWNDNENTWTDKYTFVKFGLK